MGFSHRLHPRRQRARARDGLRLVPDLPDLDLRPGGARAAQGLRVRPDAESDALAPRREPDGPRRRRRREGLRLGHGGDHGDLHVRQAGRPRRLLEHDLRRDVPLLHEDPGELRRDASTSSTRRIRRRWSGRSGPRRACCISSRRRTRRCASRTSRSSRSSPTASAPSSSSTTRSARRTSSSRSSSGRTSSCTRRRSSWAATPTPSAESPIAKAKEHVEWLGFVQNSSGAILSPMDSFLVLRGIKTLVVRMERHEANGRKVAEHLAKHPKVRQVNYPGLPTIPSTRSRRSR